MPEHLRIIGFGAPCALVLALAVPVQAQEQTQAEEQFPASSQSSPDAASIEGPNSQETAPAVGQTPPGDPTPPEELNRFPPEAAGFGRSIGPRYRVSRWAEDWSFLREDATRNDLFDPLKYIPLNDDGTTYLTLSGQQRLRYETFSNRGLREVAKQDNLLLRTIAGADLHVGKNVRVYGELASGQQWGNSRTVANQENDLIVQQLFAEVKGEVAGADAGVILGRQHFLDGPLQFVSTRENTNIQASLQGVRAYAAWPRVRVDAFSLRNIDLGTGAFDDPAEGSHFDGVVASFVVSSPESARRFYATPFFYHSVDPDRTWAGVSGREERNFIGLRTNGALGPFSVDWVGAYQTGTFNGRPLRAWSLFSNQSIALGEGANAPRIGFHADATSGGGTYEGGTLHAADTLYGVLPYLTDATSFSLINLTDVSPTLTFTPARGVTVRSEVNFLWRTDTSDAVYAGTKAPYVGTQDVPGREIGQQFRLRAAWVINPHVTLAATFEHLFAGDVLKRANYTDSTFTASQLLVLF